MIKKSVGTSRKLASTTPSLLIDRIEVIPLDIVPEVKRQMSSGAYVYGGKGGWAGRPVLVGVSAGGLTGWGEVRPINPVVGETAAAIFSNIRDFYAPTLIGRNAMDIQHLVNKCERKLPGNPASVAVVDMALHDLVGKALNIPVYMLLGGACKNEIALEWSVGLNDENSMISEAVRAVESYSVRYVCIKIGPLDRVATDYRVATAIQRKLGSAIKLGVDANMAYDTVSSIRLANRIVEAGLAYFEQPVPRANLIEMKRIRERISSLVVADESVATLDDAARIVSMGAADVFALKFYKCGGFRRCRDIAVVAESAGLMANCAGSANGSYIEAIAAAYLCASLPNHTFGSEFMMGLPSVHKDVIVANQPIDVRNGVCSLPPGPGLGFELDARSVAKHALTHLVIDHDGVCSI